MGDVIGLAKELLTLNTAQDTGLRKITVTPNDPSCPSHEHPKLPHRQQSSQRSDCSQD